MIGGVIFCALGAVAYVKWIQTVEIETKEFKDAIDDGAFVGNKRWCRINANNMQRRGDVRDWRQRSNCFGRGPRYSEQTVPCMAAPFVIPLDYYMQCIRFACLAVSAGA